MTDVKPSVDVLEQIEAAIERGRRVVELRKQRLLDLIEAEYTEFRLYHSGIGTRDTPAGFARRFREWLEPKVTDV